MADGMLHGDAPVKVMGQCRRNVSCLLECCHSQSSCHSGSLKPPIAPHGVLPELSSPMDHLLYLLCGGKGQDRRRKGQPTPVFLPGESQGRWSLVGCRLWDRTESDTTEVT